MCDYYRNVTLTLNYVWEGKIKISLAISIQVYSIYAFHFRVELLSYMLQQSKKTHATVNKYDKYTLILRQNVVRAKFDKMANGSYSVTLHLLRVFEGCLFGMHHRPRNVVAHSIVMKAGMSWEHTTNLIPDACNSNSRQVEHSTFALCWTAMIKLNYAVSGLSLSARIMDTVTCVCFYQLSQ